MTWEVSIKLFVAPSWNTTFSLWFCSWLWCAFYLRQMDNESETILYNLYVSSHRWVVKTQDSHCMAGDCRLSLTALQQAIVWCSLVEPIGTSRNLFYQPWMRLQHLLIEDNGLDNKGDYDPVDRVLDSRSEGLGFDSHWWSYVEISVSKGCPSIFRVHNKSMGPVNKPCIELSWTSVQFYMKKLYLWFFSSLPVIVLMYLFSLSFGSGHILICAVGSC